MGSNSDIIHAGEVRIRRSLADPLARRPGNGRYAAAWALVLSLFLITSAYTQDRPVDLLIINANVHTVDPAKPKAEAVAVRDGRIVFVGDSEEALKFRGDSTSVIDAKGRLVLPGFNDSHTHLIGIGNLFSVANLRNAVDAGDFAEEIARITAYVPPGRWIIGVGWDASRWRGEDPPTKEAVDAVSKENPVLLYNTDASMALVNSIGLEIAGIDSERGDLDGGEIVKDEDGEPTGLLKGQAILMAKVFARKEARDEKVDLLQTATNFAAAHGITTMQDVSSDDNADILFELESRGLLKTRVYDCIELKNWKDLTTEGRKLVSDGGLVRQGCLKSFTNGDPATLPDLYDNIKGADRAGLQVAVHAIGSRSNAYLLSLFEKAIRENPKRDRRFRSEHAQSIASEDIPKFGRLGVIPSMQPYLFYGSGPYKELLDTGASIAFGSDASITDIDPLLGISVALRNSSARDSITVADAIRLYTLGSAYAEFQEDQKGSVTKGKFADLVILSKDILTIPASEIRETKVDLTILNGNVVFRRD